MYANKSQQQHAVPLSLLSTIAQFCFPLSTPCIVQGVAVVAAGQMLQAHSHLLLASLAARRVQDTHAPHASDTPAALSPPPATESPLRHRGATGPDAGPHTGRPPAPRASGAAAGQYVVPRGGAFEWVSCPHYLAEIVIYCGFCVAQRASPLAALVLAWVVRCPACTWGLSWVVPACSRMSL